jgi:hypothetical protein
MVTKCGMGSGLIKHPKKEEILHKFKTNPTLSSQ